MSIPSTSKILSDTAKASLSSVVFGARNDPIAIMTFAPTRELEAVSIGDIILVGPNQWSEWGFARRVLAITYDMDGKIVFKYGINLLFFYTVCTLSSPDPAPQWCRPNYNSSTSN